MIEDEERIAAARALVGLRVTWAHQADDPTAEVLTVERGGLPGFVRVSGHAGEFAPDLFRVRVAAPPTPSPA